MLSVSPDARSAGRCATCRRRCPGYDAAWDAAMADGGHRDHSDVPAGGGAAGAVPRAWRLVAHVPWARPAAKSTYLLEDTVRVARQDMTPSVVAVFLRFVLADRHGHRGAGGGRPDR